MFARYIKESPDLANHYELGKIYCAAPNDMDPSLPIAMRGKRGIHHSMGPSFFSEHFEWEINGNMSDLIKKLVRSCRSHQEACDLINGAVREAGGFVWFTPQQLKQHLKKKG